MGLPRNEQPGPQPVLSDDEAGSAIRMSDTASGVSASYEQQGDGSAAISLDYPDETITGTCQPGEGQSTLTIDTRDTAGVLTEHETIVQDSNTGLATAHEILTYDEFGTLIERTVYNETGSGDWASVTAEYETGEASDVWITQSDGATSVFDLDADAATRHELGFFTQEEIAARLDQIGLSDAEDFLADGFGAVGSQNSGLDDLSISVGGTNYIWNNGFSELSVPQSTTWWQAAGLSWAEGVIAAPFVAANPGFILLLGNIGGAMNYVSPLVLDLDGDGVAPDLVHAYEGDAAFFDIDADGFAERVGWVKADDGLLAMDRNGNGMIDDITELYGDDRMPAFEKLRMEDGNHDGLVDAQDAAFANLRVWQDANQDGASQANELKTLTELDIRSISTNDHSDSRWAKENYISNVATYTRVGGETREIADVHFLNDNLNTLAAGRKLSQYRSMAPASASTSMP